MDFARLKKLVAFYGRFLVSFSALGYRGRALFWPPLRADFTGQTWVVTGATGGIGRAVVEGATSRGATVIALARSHEKLDALVGKAPGPGRVIPVLTDLSLVADTQRAADAIQQRGARIDVLVNNVGLLLDDLFAGSLVLSWTKVAPLVRGYRVAANVHDYGLRFEALARALDEHMTAHGEPHVTGD